jgi:hypothetical protein
MGCLIRSLIMLVLPLALFWVPVPGLGGFLAGSVGGYLSGSPGRAVVNALVPFAVIAVLILAVGLQFGVPVIGSALAGVAMALLIVNNVAMLAGALVGGVLRERTVRAASHP